MEAQSKEVVQQDRLDTSLTEKANPENNTTYAHSENYLLASDHEHT